MDELKYIKQLVRELIDIQEAEYGDMSFTEYNTAYLREAAIIKELKELVDAE